VVSISVAASNVTLSEIDFMFLFININYMPTQVMAIRQSAICIPKPTDCVLALDGTMAWDHGQTDIRAQSLHS
jgi:hypothetical protein